MNKINDDVKRLIYEYEGNEYNKATFNKVIEELNLKRLTDFMKYNIFDDTKYIGTGKYKTSRIYIMDMIDQNDIVKYTDYNKQLSGFITAEAINIMGRCNKLEIAKNLINHNELYNYLMDRIKGVEDEFIEDFYYDFVVDNNYFDKRIMKNEVYDNLDISTDTENEFSESEFSDDESDYYETDESEETYEDDY